MIDSISERRIDARTDDVRSNYITSHRATAACARELGRLHEAIIDGLETWRTNSAVDAAESTDIEEPVVRRTPARCLVQVGPVALTVAWLQKSQGTVGDGELLVVVWRGSVAVQAPRGFERTGDRAGASSATPVWETVLMATAASEAEWGWRRIGGADGVADSIVTSTALAEQCVERLRAAYAECEHAR